MLDGAFPTPEDHDASYSTAVPGATHLFEEVGALEEVSRLAAAWFRRYLAPRG